MNLSQLSPFLLYKFSSEHELVKSIEELSFKFTQQRDKIEDYLQDPRLASAYTAFYLTTNIPKFEAVLEWLPQAWVERLKDCDLIDLGAGPGTYSLAWKQWGGADLKGKVFQVEKSPLMREQALKIWQGFYGAEAIKQSGFWKSSEKQAERFLLFGHSANEMGPDAVMNYIQDIDPDHILFIEPGTKAFFPDMLQIRAKLLQKGFNILFPCPAHESCPLAGHENEWCHQFIHVRQSAEVERLSQLVKKDRRLLPLTVHAYSKSFKMDHHSQRVIRVHPPTKFSLEWDVCTGASAERFQIMKRGYDKASLKALESILAGAAVSTSVEKELEQSKRVKLLRVNNKLWST
jgi:ribosomal protein RSM22 (predicted rRNA methylase)